MKPSEIRSLINECVREVLNEGRASKKKKALKAIKEIITENELSEADLEEISNPFASKPATDSDIDSYLSGRPKDKAILDKDPERKKKFYDFVKANKNASKAVKSKEVVLAYWDGKEYSAQKSTASNTATSFGESKIKK